MSIAIDVPHYCASVVGPQSVKAKMIGGVTLKMPAGYGEVVLIPLGLPDKNLSFYGIDSRLIARSRPIPERLIDPAPSAARIASSLSSEEEVQAIKRKRLPRQTRSRALLESPIGTVAAMLSESRALENRRTASRAKEIELLLAIFDEDDVELGDS